MNMEMADASRLMAELQETAAELQREMRALQSASSELTPITVEDEKRAVKLTLARNGAVEALVLDEDWRDSVGEESLGFTISTCYQRALEQRIAQWMNGYAENADQAIADADVTIPKPAPVELGDPGADWAVEGREKLRALFDAAEAQQEDFLAHHARKARQTRDGVNASKTVTVTRQGATITGLTLDERWVRNTNDGVIEREIVNAMNNVMAMAARERENKYEGFPAIEELRKIAHDPRELMRRMGAIR